MLSLCYLAFHIPSSKVDLFSQVTEVLLLLISSQAVFITKVFYPASRFCQFYSACKHLSIVLLGIHHGKVSSIVNNLCTNHFRYIDGKPSKVFSSFTKYFFSYTKGDEYTITPLAHSHNLTQRRDRSKKHLG